jgi:long-chain acyl-CoA synthetase
LNSVGPALPGVEIRLESTGVAASGNGQEPVEGEILARGPSVFAGYRQLPDQTAEAFTPDGWFHTGDLGYFDEEGYLYISGRASTLIVTEGGKNIQPEPLEEVYQAHPFIREIGILQADNHLVALIVPEIDEINWHRNGDVGPAIREAVNDRLQTVASYQRITDYALTDLPLPRTNLGKIQRHTLTKYYYQAKQGAIQADPGLAGPISIEDLSEKDQALLADPLVRQVWDWLAERYPDRRLTPETSPQLDLGIDSMEWLTLTLELSQRTGVELSDTAIGRITTVRDLLMEVQAAATGGESVQRFSLEDSEVLLTDKQKKWLSPRGIMVELLAALIFFPMRWFARLYFRLTAHGLENIPAHSNFVLTPNHLSFLDAPMVAAVLPYPLTRQTYWAASTNTLFNNPLVKLISWVFQAVPIEHQRAGAGLQSLALGAAVLQRRKNLVWFPEGNITRSAGMLPFQEGIGLILEAQPTPVVPVYIQGTRDALPRGDWFPRPKPITITFGLPCDPRQLAEEGEGANIPTRISRALQARVIALSEPSPAEKLEKPGRNLARTSMIEIAAILFVLALVWFLLPRKKSK